MARPTQFGRISAPDEAWLAKRSPEPILEPDLPITVFGVAEDADLVKRYRDAGVARLIFNLPPAKADEVLPVLDRCAALMRQVQS